MKKLFLPFLRWVTGLISPDAKTHRSTEPVTIVIPTSAEQQAEMIVRLEVSVKHGATPLAEHQPVPMVSGDGPVTRVYPIGCEAPPPADSRG